MRCVSLDHNMKIRLEEDMEGPENSRLMTRLATDLSYADDYLYVEVTCKVWVFMYRRMQTDHQ